MSVMRRVHTLDLVETLTLATVPECGICPNPVADKPFLRPYPFSRHRITSD